MAAVATDHPIRSTTYLERDVMPERRAQRYTCGAWVPPRALLSLCGLASCTGSSVPLALQPNFEVGTPADVASVSIRESPPGMTDTEFALLIRAGMERGTRSIMIAGDPAPPHSTARIVGSLAKTDGFRSL
jgi:hypothetical protein